jgi:beta-glucosidase
VDAEAAEAIVGNARFRAAGEAAQRRSIVLLKNGSIGAGAALPLREARRIYVEGVAPEVAARYGQVVAEQAAAEVAILRLAAPFEPRDSRPLESFFHAGSLAFAEEERARILRIAATVPPIICIHLDRPAVIPEIAEAVAGLLADFGASDAVVLDVIFGQAAPSARLPFELPSSMEAVRRQKEDVPYDSENPLFRFGHGLRY